MADLTLFVARHNRTWKFETQRKQNELYNAKNAVEKVRNGVVWTRILINDKKKKI